MDNVIQNYKNVIKYYFKSRPLVDRSDNVSTA